ncbi:TatD family hydrolase [bacterium]|nr:TatD family hydrolase [bacterium]
MLYDTHCHLDAAAFAADRDAALARARSAGVTLLLVPAVAPGLPAVTGEGIVLAAGCHPYEAAKWEGGADAVRAALPAAVAVGETGLDFAGRCPATAAEQQTALRAQLALAAEHGLPVILHERDAFDALVAIVSEYKGSTGVFHAFHHGPRAAERVLGLGFHLGLGGMLTYPAQSDLRAAAALAPANRLLLETDAPWLPPQGHRGKRNEPSLLPLVLARLAEVRGESEEALAACTTANSVALFGGSR